MAEDLWVMSRVKPREQRIQKRPSPRGAAQHAVITVLRRPGVRLEMTEAMKIHREPEAGQLYVSSPVVFFARICTTRLAAITSTPPISRLTVISSFA